MLPLAALADDDFSQLGIDIDAGDVLIAQPMSQHREAVPLTGADLQASAPS